jgi:RHS repeat-associated protein
LGQFAGETARIGNAVSGSKSYTYTPTGMLRSAIIRTPVAVTHEINCRYDAQGRLTRQDETGGITKTYSYNAANHPTEFRTMLDGVLRISNGYAYDIAQRPSRISTAGMATSYTYDRNGNRTRMEMSNGVVANYAYNLAGLATSVTNQRGAATLSRFDYSYLLDGNTHTVTDQRATGTRTTTYTYDLARRLTLEADTSNITAAPSISRSYVFDNRSNRVRMFVWGAENYTTNYTYDLNNRLLTEERTATGANATSSTTNFTYDNNGNQRTQVINGQTETRNYNAFNQLTSLTRPAMATMANPAAMTVSYTYRADGLRDSKTVNGTRTNHVWDGSHIVMERNASGAITNRFDRHLDGGLILNNNQGWATSNARGDVVQMITLQGAVRDDYHYGAFGMERSTNANDANPWMFNGEHRDAELGEGEYYLRARSYSPRLGRFTSQDGFWNPENMQFGDTHTLTQSDIPIPNASAIMQSSNLYTYTMNNPVMWSDPSGLNAQNNVGDLFNKSPQQLREAGISFGTGINGSINSITKNGVTIRHCGRVTINSIIGWDSYMSSGGSLFSMIAYSFNRVTSWLDEVLAAIEASNETRRTSTNHGSFTASSAAFQLNPVIELNGIPVHVGFNSYVGRISVSPSNLGSFAPNLLNDSHSASVGLRFFYFSGGSTLAPWGLQHNAVASLATGYISTTSTLDLPIVGPVTITGSLMGHFGLGAGSYMARTATGIRAGISKKFGSVSVSLSRR